MNDGITERLTVLAENGIGYYLRIHREAKGYSQREICDGICSVPVLSRVEAGERTVDFLMIEAFLSRMKIKRTEYEFVLDDEDYYAYKQREEIEALVKGREYRKAEECMEAYEGRYGAEKLQGQFLAYQKALLTLAKPGQERQKTRVLFQKALIATAPEFRKKYEGREILSNLELFCIAEMMRCTEEPAQQEREYEGLYAYFAWSCSREGFFPEPYRTAMQYYAECLYKTGKYEKCIRICDETLKEMFKTSKAENRDELFFLRAKAREGRGIASEEERTLCLKDFLTAYHMRAFYGGEEKADALKRYIGGKYGWQFTD